MQPFLTSSDDGCDLASEAGGGESAVAGSGGGTRRGWKDGRVRGWDKAGGGCGSRVGGWDEADPSFSMLLGSQMVSSIAVIDDSVEARNEQGCSRTADIQLTSLSSSESNKVTGDYVAASGVEEDEAIPRCDAAASRTDSLRESTASDPGEGRERRPGGLRGGH